jgi:hypothetical protein
MHAGSARHHGRRERLTSASVLAVLLLLPGAGAATPAPGGTDGEFTTAPLVEQPVARDLRELLALVDGNLPLRVTLASRDLAVGHPWRVYGDTLLLVPPAAWESGRTPGPEDLRGVSLDDIVRVEQSRSGARAGAGWGAKSGALVVGGLGLLFGAVVASLSEGDSDAMPVVALGAIGAAVGALAGGGIGAGVGAGVGALGRNWVTLWPLADAGGKAPPDVTGGDSLRRTRFQLEGAWSFDDGAEDGGRGLGARVGLVRRLSDAVELGPFAEYHDLRGTYWYDSRFETEPPTGGFLAARNGVFALGLDVHAHSRGAGFGPIGSAGIGWSLSEDLYLGAHAGAGARWRGSSGHVFSLLVRRYFEVAGTQAREGRFWSIAAGITFGR